MELLCCMVVVLVIVVCLWQVLYSENSEYRFWAGILLVFAVIVALIAGLEAAKDYTAQMAVKNFFARAYDVPVEQVRVTAKTTVDSYRGSSQIWEMEVRFTKNGDQYILRATVDSWGNVLPEKPVPNMLKGAHLLRSLIFLHLLL